MSDGDLIDPILAMAKLIREKGPEKIEFFASRTAPYELIKAFKDGGYRVRFADHIPAGEIVAIDRNSTGLIRG